MKINSKKIFIKFIVSILVTGLIFSFPVSHIKSSAYTYIQNIINISKDEIYNKGFDTAVQSALNTARQKATDTSRYKVIIPSGIYTVSKSIRLYSNTELCLDDVTLIRNKDSKINIIRTGDVDTVDTGATGYAYRNITVTGGILNGNATSNTILKVAHTSNFIMTNVTLKNVADGHITEVAGVDGFTVKNCNFSDQTMSSNIGYEAIQLDILVGVHFASYRSEDLPIRNVLIENCNFNNCPRGIGSHTGIENNPFDSIVIRNNTFTDIGSVAIQSLNWQNCQITGNTITNSPRGIAIYSIIDGGRGTYNRQYLANEGKTSVHNEYWSNGCNNIIISDNVISKCGSIKDNYAIYDSGGIMAIGGNVDNVTIQPDGSGNISKGNYYIGNVAIKNNVINVRGHGIRLTKTNSDNTFVENNNITCYENNFNNSNYHGIYLFDNANVYSVSNNKIVNSNVNGIYVYKKSYVTTIQNNIVTTANRYGISVDNSSCYEIWNNSVSNTGSNGIQISNGGVIQNAIGKNKINNIGNNGINVTNYSESGLISDNTITNYNGIMVNVTSTCVANVGKNYDYLSPTSVSLNKKSATLGVGETLTLTKTVYPETANQNVSWSTSDKNIATVSNGKITAKKTGSAIITVKTSNGKTTACKITVKKAPTSISLNKTSLTLGIGEIFDLNSKLPDGQASRVVTYKSGNTKTATVDGNGVVTAKSVGTAIITAKTYNGKTATCVVTVKKAPTSISLNKTSLTLGIGESFDLNSKFPDGQASRVVTYKSGNTKTATVDNNGLVTGKSVGTVKITAETYNGKKAVCTVTIKKAPTSISLNKTSLTLGIGENFDLNSKFPDGQVSRVVTYTSGNSSVATVDSNGIVTGKSVGIITITAKTYNGKVATCKVTVKKAPTSISLNKTSLTLGIGEIFDLNSKLPEGQTSRVITYTSSNSIVATVDGNGIVTAKSLGTAIITAKTYNGKVATCMVTVKKAPTNIVINKTNVILGIGKTFNIVGKLQNNLESGIITYTSCNTEIATVNNNGLITGKSKGSVKINASTYNGKVATCIVTVKNIPVNIMMAIEEKFDVHIKAPDYTQ